MQIKSKNYNKEKYLKLPSEKKGDNSNLNDSLIFSKEDRITTINNSHSSNSAELYDIIKSQAPLSVWRLTGISPFSYSFVKNKIRELEFVKLIYTKIRINLKGRQEKIIYVPKTPRSEEEAEKPLSNQSKELEVLK